MQNSQTETVKCARCPRGFDDSSWIVAPAHFVNWRNSRLHSFTPVSGEQTAQACANACFRQLLKLQ